MPIFEKKGNPKILYIHVPKTGGTYLEDLFRKNGYRMHFWHASPESLSLRCSPQHYHRKLYENLLILEQFDYAFMTVRNPIDRLMSEYRHQMISKTISVSCWLMQVERDFLANPFCHDNHLRPQVDFYHPSIEVFKQENGFDSRWVEHLEAAIPLSLKKKTVRRRRHTSKDSVPVDKNDREQIIEFCLKHYQDDFKFFQYELQSSRLFMESK